MVGFHPQAKTTVLRHLLAGSADTGGSGGGGGKAHQQHLGGTQQRQHLKGGGQQQPGPSAMRQGSADKDPAAHTSSDPKQEEAMRPCPRTLTVLHLLRAMCLGSTPSLVAACCQLLTPESNQTLQVRLQAIASEFTSLSRSFYLQNAYLV